MRDQIAAMLKKNAGEMTPPEEERFVSAYERMQEITRKVKPFVKPFRLVRVPVARKWRSGTPD